MAALRWFLAVAMSIFFIAGAAAVGLYLHDGLGGLRSRHGDGGMVSYEKPRIIPGAGTNISVTLTTSPTYGARPYFGLLTPYVIVTYVSDTGGLQSVLNHVEVTLKSNVGVDACGSKLVFDTFTIVSPIGGATNATTNVTYASDSYASPIAADIPSGDHCAARADVEGIWDIYLCSEGDGQISPPHKLADGSIVIDSWDSCGHYPYHGRLL